MRCWPGFNHTVQRFGIVGIHMSQCRIDAFYDHVKLINNLFRACFVVVSDCM